MIKPEPLGETHSSIRCRHCDRLSWHDENIKAAVAWLRQVDAIDFGAFRMGLIDYEELYEKLTLNKQKAFG